MVPMIWQCLWKTTFSNPEDLVSVCRKKYLQISLSDQKFQVLSEKGTKLLFFLNWSIFTSKFDSTKKLPVFDGSPNPIQHLSKYLWADPGGFIMLILLFYFFVSLPPLLICKYIKYYWDSGSKNLKKLPQV